MSGRALRQTRALVTASWSRLRAGLRAERRSPPPVPPDIADRVVMVTGAASGIGRALVAGFLADGASVVAFNHAPDPAPGPSDGRLLTVVGDVASPEDVARAVRAATDRFERIDVLVNNAGVLHRGEFLSQSFETWTDHVRVNLVGLALCTHRVLPGMVQRGRGRIVNLVSRAAETAAPGTSGYASSKAAVISLTRVLAREVGPPRNRDVLVNAVIPGPTRTKMNPGGAQEPTVVYPHVRFVATLPAGGPNGRLFWESREYAMYTRFNT